MNHLARLLPVFIGVAVVVACAALGVTPHLKFFGAIATAVSILCSLTVASNTMLFTIQTSHFAKLLRGYGQTVRFRQMMADSVRLGFISLVTALAVVALDEGAPNLLRWLALASGAAGLVALYRVTNLFVTIFSDHEVALAQEEQAKRARAIAKDRIDAEARDADFPAPVEFEPKR